MTTDSQQFTAAGPRLSIELPAGGEAAAMARHATRLALASADLGHLEDNVTLLVSELVGNAVRHARGGPRSMELRPAAGGDLLRVEVIDSDPSARRSASRMGRTRAASGSYWCRRWRTAGACGPPMMAKRSGSSCAPLRQPALPSRPRLERKRATAWETTKAPQGRWVPKLANTDRPIGGLDELRRAIVGFRRVSREECGAVLAEGFVSLASLAGRTVAAAAVTDAWEMAKQGFARLLGCGDSERTGVAERRLEQTREELAGIPAAELERAHSQLEAAWQTRLLDLLEEHPETAADLQALVEQVQAQLPAGAVSAAGHGVAVGRDVNITASGGGVAAGTVHGNVTPGNPTSPGLANH